MAEPFISEITIFAGNFVPRGWAACDGTEMPANQIGPIRGLIGSTYGGDGVNTIRLPNLNNNAPMHPGYAPGLSNRKIGETGGDKTITLSDNQMPMHEHSLNGRQAGQSGSGNSTNPANAAFAVSSGVASYHSKTNSLVSAARDLLPHVGDNQPHNNMHPFIGMRYIIALQGAYPIQA